LFANRGSWQDAWKRRKLEGMRMLLEGAINALCKVRPMLSVHRNDLRAVLEVLPARMRPAISHLSDGGIKIAAGAAKAGEISSYACSPAPGKVVAPACVRAQYAADGTVLKAGGCAAAAVSPGANASPHRVS
jgi:glycine cleavage system aminomethyltransferase T